MGAATSPNLKDVTVLGVVEEITPEETEILEIEILEIEILEIGGSQEKIPRLVYHHAQGLRQQKIFLLKRPSIDLI